MSVLRSKPWWCAVLVVVPALAFEWRMTIAGVPGDVTENRVGYSRLESVQLGANLSAGATPGARTAAMKDVVVGKTLAPPHPSS